MLFVGDSMVQLLQQYEVLLKKGGWRGYRNWSVSLSNPVADGGL